MGIATYVFVRVPSARSAYLPILPLAYFHSVKCFGDLPGFVASSTDTEALDVSARRGLCFFSGDVGRSRQRSFMALRNRCIRRKKTGPDVAARFQLAERLSYTASTSDRQPS